MSNNNWRVDLIPWPFGNSWCIWGPHGCRFERFDRHDGKPSEYWEAPGAVVQDRELRRKIDELIQRTGQHRPGSLPRPQEKPPSPQATSAAPVPG
ncbi:hypothetical protein [Caldimonas tepidiphila]|uniref:hypothetical protein n=1 Tax=Caldimonas tepidiphila TaxID=2315841 RepID=UPI000E5B2848|nr:hypothetical protein [Caldimonas tepidiphila]